MAKTAAERAGKVVGNIPVEISYRIIELFSGGLYSSPHKAFEELVTNSYDADAQRVGAYVPEDLTKANAYIWIIDDGESMNSEGLRDLWKIGESRKREKESENGRKKIGRFGIGKLATYIIARKLTYICKVGNVYRAVTMDYEKIPSEGGIKTKFWVQWQSRSENPLKPSHLNFKRLWLQALH